MPQSTKQHKDNKGLLAIFKGESGSGKSVAALSFPNAYVFDFDKKMPAISQKHFPDKEVFWDTFDTVFDTVKVLNEFQDSCPYDTLIADSVSGMVNLCLNSYFDVKGLPFEETIYSKNKKGDMESIPLDFYNSEDRFCTWFTDQLKGLWARPGRPYHVIFTAHVVTVTSDPNPMKNNLITQTRGIAAKGKKFPAWLPTGFDNVYIFGQQQPDIGEIEQTTKRIVRTDAYGEDSAKCSYPFPQAINFTNKSFYERLTKEFGLPHEFEIPGQKRIGSEIHDAEFVE